MRDVGAAIRSSSDARDLCLALKRARNGARSLARLRAGAREELTQDELRLALGLALAAGERDLVRRTLARLPPEGLRADATLLTFRDVVAQTGDGR